MNKLEKLVVVDTLTYIHTYILLTEKASELEDLEKVVVYDEIDLLLLAPADHELVFILQGSVNINQ